MEWTCNRLWNELVTDYGMNLLFINLRKIFLFIIHHNNKRLRFNLTKMDQLHIFKYLFRLIFLRWKHKYKQLFYFTIYSFKRILCWMWKDLLIKFKYQKCWTSVEEYWNWMIIRLWFVWENDVALLHIWCDVPTRL